VVERTEEQVARVAERRERKAAARQQEGPAPSLTSWGSLVEKSDPDASPDADSDDDVVTPAAALFRTKEQEMPSSQLLRPKQDAANFRVAVAQVLRQALATSIGDAIDGRSLGEHTWIES